MDIVRRKLLLVTIGTERINKGDVADLQERLEIVAQNGKRSTKN